MQFKTQLSNKPIKYRGITNCNKFDILNIDLIKYKESNMLKYIAILFCTVSLCACNTLSGAGKDIEKGGEVIQDAAHGAQQK